MERSQRDGNGVRDASRTGRRRDDHTRDPCFLDNMDHHHAMKNQDPKIVAGRISAAREANSSKSLGMTRDGVTILKPKTKPTHFTTREIRSTIAQILRQSRLVNKTNSAIGKATETAKR